MASSDWTFPQTLLTNENATFLSERDELCLRREGEYNLGTSNNCLRIKIAQLASKKCFMCIAGGTKKQTKTNKHHVDEQQNK